MAATVAVGFVDAVVRVMAGYDPEMSLKPKQRESLKRIYESTVSCTRIALKTRIVRHVFRTD